jgi:hypothetical protein
MEVPVSLIYQVFKDLLMMRSPSTPAIRLRVTPMDTNIRLELHVRNRSPSKELIVNRVFMQRMRYQHTCVPWWDTAFWVSFAPIIPAGGVKVEPRRSATWHATVPMIRITTTVEADRLRDIEDEGTVVGPSFGKGKPRLEIRAGVETNLGSAHSGQTEIPPTRFRLWLNQLHEHDAWRPTIE